MSNGNGGNNCGKIMRSGNTMFFMDTKMEDSKDKKHYGTSGLLAVMEVAEYEERLAKVKETKDARHFFNSPEQHETLDQKEMTALAAYAGERMLDTEVFAEDLTAITARRSMSDLTPDQQIRYQAPALVGAAA
jgi:hypothetical protein